MISRASSCKWLLIKKHLSRFWLLSVGIFLFLLAQGSDVLGRITILHRTELWEDWAYALRFYMYTGTEVISAFLVAAFVFSYLHSKKKSSFFCSLPCTRDSLFLSGYLIGLVFYILPWLLVTGYYGLRIFLLIGDEPLFLLTFLEAALYRLLLYITFFGFATLGMVVSGRSFFGILTGLVFTVILPFIESLFSGLVESLAFGITADSFFLSYLSPFYLLAPKYGSDNDLSVILLEGGAFAVGSAGLSFLALLLHRKRKEENVGQSLIFRPANFLLQAVLTLLFTFLCLIPYALIAQELTVHILIPFSVPGFFLARMLLLRRGNVFQRGTFLGCGVYVLLLCALIFSFQFDLFGIVRKVPQGDRVQTVRISTSDGLSFTSQDPTDVEEVLALHRHIIAERSAIEAEEDYEYEGEDIHLYLTYTMGSGRSISRTYLLSGESTDEASAEIIEETKAFFRQSDRIEKQLQMLREETASISFVSDGTKNIDLSTLQQQDFFRVLEEDLASGIDPLFLYGTYRPGIHVVLHTSIGDSINELFLPKEATATLTFLENIEKETFPNS